MSGAWNQGSLYQGDGHTRFQVWAPKAQNLQLVIYGKEAITHEMTPQPNGYFTATVRAEPGALYKYRIGTDVWPDPASRSQPEGVHGPSAVVDPTFYWKQNDWRGIPLEQYIIYELHVGTFTNDGTFDALIPQLSYLRDLGVTAVELMPIAQFPGTRNWGYDGVYPYAAQHSYGGVQGLKRFVDAAHEHGLAVVLDVVYNHLGPEGNYLSLFGHYFTDNYRTPWGSSLNFDGEWSDEVRRYFIGNALFWIEDCRIDALRLDAVHAIIDTSAEPFLRGLSREVKAAAERLNREVFLIAENDRNDPAFARPAQAGGIGMDSQWNDDFHHALHSVVTGEQHGYYSDFGAVSQLARTFERGFVFEGEYSEHRHRSHGSPVGDLEGKRFVICGQNHDQVGNRALGDRFGTLISFELQRLAAAAVLLSPNIPLLFMGEEYGETAPFLYFVSHGDEALIEGVRKGRAEEFAAFHAKGEAPDPQSETTLERSRLNERLPCTGEHHKLLEWYKELVRLRREHSALKTLDRQNTRAVADDAARTLVLTRKSAGSNATLLALFNFGDASASVTLEHPAEGMQIILDSRAAQQGGAGTNAASKLNLTPGRAVELPPTSVLIAATQ